MDGFPKRDEQREIIPLIRRIVAALENIEDRISEWSAFIPNLVAKVNRILDILENDSNSLQFSAKIRTTPSELRAMLTNSATMDLQALTLDVTMAQAVYMGVRNERDKKLEQILSESQIRQARDLVASVDRMNRMIQDGAMDKQEIRIEKALARLESSVKNAEVLGAKMGNFNLSNSSAPKSFVSRRK